MTKVLVVDDEKNLRTLYASELGDEGYEVMVARDGKEALRILESEHPDLVVLDIRMAGLNGLETMSRMLALNNRLPIILNTAYTSYKESFLSWSADAYVVKSADMAELKAKIREVLSRAEDGERRER
jgi:DNA-binding response OmpR family regulator